MRIDVVTLFPDLFPPYLTASILGRAQEGGRLTVRVHGLRDYAADRYRTTDKPPFGGGGGMVLRPDPIFAAVEAALAEQATAERPPIILLTPQGRVFNQSVAAELSRHPRLVLICGRYEGVDERVRAYLATDELSIGDYVLTGGELAALVVIDAVARLLPGVLGAEHAAADDSHATGLLEGPHYTKPVSFRGWDVPALLRSGDNKQIARWRRQQALRRTWERRPELLLTAPLTPDDRLDLMALAQEETDRLRRQA